MAKNREKAVVSFFCQDQERTLFPLNTSLTVVKRGATALLNAIDRVGSKDDAFAPQQHTFAEKKGRHLRRTLKLDPLAELFLYDLVWQHRSAFRRGRNRTRISSGYSFHRGSLDSPRGAYATFQKEVSAAASRHRHSLKVDVSSYFNTIYHHDLVRFFEDATSSRESAAKLGNLLRLINSGRSVDFLPQGIAPTKVLGSHYLRFIDESKKLRSRLLLRFMDDIYFFSESSDHIGHDFYHCQELLSQRGLYLNASKTRFDVCAVRESLEDDVDEIRESLFDWERDFGTVSGEEESWDDEDDFPELSDEQVAYLHRALETDDVDDDVVELVLLLMRDHADDFLDQVDTFLEKTPHLSKSLYHFSEHIYDKTGLASIILRFAKRERMTSDFQLFWLTKIAEDHLAATPQFGDILMALATRSGGTIAKAKVLEIPERRFGIEDIREEHLRSGESGWLSWASAVGSSRVPRSQRNHLLKYFAKGSQLNRLVGQVAESL